VRWLSRGLASALAMCACAARTAVTEDHYARAEALLEWNVPRIVHGADVEPHWIGRSDRFWYRLGTAKGPRFIRVDARSGKREQAFDHGKLAAALQAVLDRPVSSNELPFESFEYRSGESALRLNVGGATLDCDLSPYRCAFATGPDVISGGEVASPDGRWAAFVRSHDLYVRPLQGGAEIRLTHDGKTDHGYGEWADSHLLSVTAERAGAARPARVLWSPDSKRLLTYRIDQRSVSPMPFVRWVPAEGYGHRPKVYSARVPLPADERISTAELMVFGVPDGRRMDIPGEPLPLYYDLISWGYVWWHEDGARVLFVREERGFRKAVLSIADAASGDVRLILSETSPTYVKADYDGWAITGTGASHVLWRSSREGWQHLYRYRIDSGARASPVTRGDWDVREVSWADPEHEWIYFTGGGREPGRDPYYSHLYRARADGSGLQLLTPEDAHHRVSFSPTGRYFVDHHSRVDSAPVTTLRAVDGRLILVLEVADISPLLARGWQKPERFNAKARDGRTDIYGTLYRPSRFDPGARYPVLDDIYGGPQAVQSRLTFAAGEPLAELGFVIVQIDGMGTPGRSRAFQEVSYGSGFAEAGGLEDHIAVLRQLAAKNAWMDLDRVGIYGYSGGGYSSTRAVLDHPEFFKVAVSAAGSHDQRLYQLEWGERFIGRPAGDPMAYALQANSGHVARFAGKLLLAHGDLDDDVPLVNTMQLVDALVAANKDFDLLIVPGQNHETMYYDPYFLRRRWDYFVRHLLGVEPPPGYRIRPPP
jgi:dipeptidyl-peptidase-4